MMIKVQAKIVYMILLIYLPPSDCDDNEAAKLMRKIHVIVLKKKTVL